MTVSVEVGHDHSLVDAESWDLAPQSEGARAVAEEGLDDAVQETADG